MKEYESCPCCRMWQTQPVRAVVEAMQSDSSDSMADCVAKSYGIKSLSERLALPPKPHLLETFLASASIFVGEDVEIGDKVFESAPAWAQDDYAELLAKWEIQRLLWERLWYCADCDSVFDPMTRQFEASKDIAILIRS